MPVCRRCGQENPEGFRLCGMCGAALAPAPASREERKVVTVLFADVVGFTSRAEQLDPEDVRAVLSPYHARLRRELEAFGGTVEKFIGDAVVAVFGAPTAHEDDPERAVRAGLAIREAMAAMNEERPGLDLHVRVGVNTGEALVALDARPEEGEGMVAGDVVNTAARLQSAAPVDGILVGHSTYRATAHAIEYGEEQRIEAKGKAEPVPAWPALDARARLGIDVLREVRTPLVGREHERDLLARALERVRAEGAAQLTTLVGPPGIGKSRLVYELLQVVEADPDLLTWRQGRSLPYGDGVSLWALGEMVKAQAGILETDDDEATLEKLRRSVADLGPDADEERWIDRRLRPLVGVAGSEHEAANREEAFAAWRRYFELIAASRPTVLVFEDLHWADDGLLDFVDHLIDWAGAVPLLVVGTARPELLARRPGWGGGKPNATTVSLAPLSDTETAKLIAALLERPVLPAEVQAELLARAGGNPLYAEEFVRMAAERGLEEVSSLPVPETVQGILAARLDGLDPDEKEALRNAAVVGKVFWLGAVAALGGLERPASERLLHALERRQLIRRERRSSVEGETAYAFWHALAADVAYGQIPRGERVRLHRRTADWIASLGADRLEDRAELLAHHYEAALELSRAAGLPTAELERLTRLALRAAGDRARSLQSMQAAERLYARALELWPEDDPARGRLLLGYAVALRAHSEGDRGVTTAARDALLASGDHEGAGQAEMMLCDIAWLRGEGELAQKHLDRALELVERAEPSESKATASGEVARMLMLAGRPREALETGSAALELAERLGADEVRSNVLNTIGTTRMNLGDRGGVADLERGLDLAERVGSPWNVTRAYVNLGSTQDLVGNVAEGLRLREAGLELCRRYAIVSGARWLTPELALARYRRGRWDDALELAEPFLAEIEAGQPHYLEAEARLVRGSIRLARGEAGGHEDVETMLQRGRDARDPQILQPALGEAARLLVQVGDRAGAAAAADELLAGVHPDAEDRLVWSYWLVPLAAALVELGRGEEVVRLCALAVPTPWAAAAEAWARGDFARAADLLEAIESLPDAAEARVRAATAFLEEGRRPEADRELGRALAFYRSVGATAFAREAEALLPAAG